MNGIGNTTDYCIIDYNDERIIALPKSLRYARRYTTLGVINHMCYGAKGDIGT